MNESLYQRLPEGETAIRALVDRFYDLMDREPAYAELRAQHPRSLDSAREKLFWYLCGWTGGAPHYTDRFGHPRLRARHMPFAISERESRQWLACMQQACEQSGLAPAWCAELLAALAPLADWMRNRASAPDAVTPSS